MSKRRRLIIFATIIIVVIGASATAAILLSRQNNSADQSNNSTDTSGVPKEQPAEIKADSADKLASDGDVNGGVQQLDNAIKGTSDTSEQFIYYSRKATLLFNNNDLVGALAAAQSAYDIKKTSDSAAFVGQIAQQKGDNAMALDYYKKAISLIDPKDPFANNDKAYYQGIVDELGGGK